MQESYNNTSSLDLFVNGSVSEDNCKIIEQEGSLSIKKKVSMKIRNQYLNHGSTNQWLWK